MTDRNEALRLADSIHEMNNAAYMTAIANLNEKNRQQAEQLDAELCNREVLDKMLTQCIAERDQLQAELTEQARIIGMGAERELALIAERDQLRAEVESKTRALRIIHTWAGVPGALKPDQTRQLCGKELGIDHARTTHKDEG